MSTPNSSFFSRKLRALRGKRSQQEFAEFLGIGSQQAYQRYENGRLPRIDVLTRISQRIGVSVESFIGVGVDFAEGSTLKSSMVVDRKTQYNFGKIGRVDEFGNVSTPIETYVELLDAQIAARRWNDASITARQIAECCERKAKELAPVSTTEQPGFDQQKEDR